METILIQTNSEKEAKLVHAFLQQNKIKSKVLSDEHKEDILLLNLMEETNYDELVDTNAFLTKLRS